MRTHNRKLFPFVTFIALLFIHTKAITQIPYRSVSDKQIDSILPRFVSSQKELSSKKVSIKFNVHERLQTTDTIPYYKVLKFGTEVLVSFSEKDAVVKILDSIKYSILQLEVPGSTELGITLSNISISDASEIYLLNNDNTIIAGPIRKKNFNWERTPFIRMSVKTVEKIYLVIKEQVTNKNIPNSFVIPRIFADNSFNDNSINLRSSSTECMPNVQCFPTKSQISRAVARIEIPDGNTTWRGTGTLISNELGDGRAFFITAKHVLDFNEDDFIDTYEQNQLLSAVFKFQFWNSGCNSTTTEFGIDFLGAVVRIQSLTNDMILIELLNPPGIGDGVTYAGWNRQPTLPLENGSFVAHHPAGEHMRGALTRNVNHYMWDPTRWSVFYRYGEEGAATTGGSSGAALFNESNQVVGTLFKGLSRCGSQSLGDQYEKFEQFWYAGMGYYLSPSNWMSVSGIQTYNMEISGDEHVPCAGTITFSVPPFTGCTFNWTVSPNLQIISGFGTNTIQVQRLNNSSTTGSVQIVINDSKGYNTSETITKLLTLIPPINGLYNTCSNRDPIILSDYNAVCGGETKVYMDEDVLSWSLIYGTPNSWSTFNPSNDLKFNINQNDYVIFELTATDGCQVFTRPYVFEATQEQSFRIFQVYPNPASSIIKIEQSQESKKENLLVEIKQIVIQNYSGKVFVDKKFESKTITTNIDVSSLPKDNYIVRIYNGKRWYTEKLIINK